MVQCVYICLDFVYGTKEGKIQKFVLTWLEYILIILMWKILYHSAFTNFSSLTGCGSKMLWSCVQKEDEFICCVYLH